MVRDSGCRLDFRRFVGPFVTVDSFIAVVKKQGVGLVFTFKECSLTFIGTLAMANLDNFYRTVFKGRLTKTWLNQN